MSKFDLTNAGFATRAIHEGQGFDKATGALSTPIYQTSTFCFESVDEAMTKFRGEEKGSGALRSGLSQEYGRHSRPESGEKRAVQSAFGVPL